MKIKKYEPDLYEPDLTVTAHIKGVESPQGASVGSTMGELENVGRAFYRLGETLDKSISKLGSEIVKIEQRKNQERQKREYYDSIASVEEAWQGFKSEVDRMRPDPDEYVDRTRRGWEAIVKERGEKIQDPEVRREFQTAMTKRWLSILPNVTADADKLWKEREAASVYTEADKFKRLAQKATNSTDFELNKGRMIDVLHNSDFIFGKERATLLEKQYIEALDRDRQTELKNQLTTNILRDPTMAILEIAGGQWDELNEADREALREKAVTHEKLWLESKRREEERIQKEQHDNEELEVYKLYATGKLTVKDLLRAQYLTADERYTWEQRLIAKENNAARIKTNFAIKAQLREDIEMIETPEDLKEYIKILADVSDKYLSQSDAEQLLEKAMNRLEGIDKVYLQRIHREFRAEFAPTSDVLGLPRVPEEDEDLSKAQNLLDQEIALAKKRGKPLSGIEIYKKGREIIQNRDTLIGVRNKREDIRGRVKREREKMRAQPPGGSHKIPPRMPNETVEDYLKRIAPQGK